MTDLLSRVTTAIYNAANIYKGADLGRISEDDALACARAAIEAMGRPSREAVAKIVDPSAFDWGPLWPRQGFMSGPIREDAVNRAEEAHANEGFERRKTAVAKANAILALSPLQPQSEEPNSSSVDESAVQGTTALDPERPHPTGWRCRSCGSPFASAGGKIVGGTCPSDRPTCPLEAV